LENRFGQEINVVEPSHWCAATQHITYPGKATGIFDFIVPELARLM
jgi:hypothetical protein